MITLCFNELIISRTIKKIYDQFYRNFTFMHDFICKMYWSLWLILIMNIIIKKNIKNWDVSLLIKYIKFLRICESEVIVNVKSIVLC